MVGALGVTNPAEIIYLIAWSTDIDSFVHFDLDVLIFKAFKDLKENFQKNNTIPSKIDGYKIDLIKNLELLQCLEKKFLKEIFKF